MDVVTLGIARSTAKLLDGQADLAAGVGPTAPWRPAPAIGPELWALANFKGGGLPNENTSSLTPHLTYNGGSQQAMTYIDIGAPSVRNQSFRVSMDVDVAPTHTGTWAITAAVVDTSGTLISGTVDQWMVDKSATWMPGKVLFEFKVGDGAWATGSTYLRINVYLANDNSTGDQLGISNVSVREVGTAQRPITYVNDGGGAGRRIYVPLFDPTNKKWCMASTLVTTDGALTTALQEMYAFNTDRPFQADTADPAFAAAWTGGPGGYTISLAGGESRTQVRIGNNDQIVEVQKADLSYELRGNTHGGETLRTAAVWEADYGDGVWHVVTGNYDNRRYAKRLRLTWNTQLARSSPDSDTFANVDHTTVFFPDGVQRTDRLTTFLKAMRVRALFEWMSSHPTDVAAVGRIGAGHQVLENINATVGGIDSAVSHRATWGVWYDSTTNVCLANIFDRNAVATRPGVAGVKNQLASGGGVRKNYATVHWTGDGSPSLPVSETRLVPNAEAWTATHWTYVYVPADPTNYHREAAALSLDLAALKAAYPAT